MTVKIALAGWAAVGLLFGSVDAQAHAHLKSADPAAEASVHGSPKGLRATFSEALVEPFSGLDLQTDKGAPVAIGKTSLDPKDDHTLIAPIPTALPPGRYVVHWRAVSIDTHRMTGRYGLRVLP